MSDFNVWSYFAKLGVQVRGPGDPFFQDGDTLCKTSDPVILTVEDVEEFLHKDYQEFPCQIPGCTARFSQLYESEVHYNAVHKHSCSVCKRSLPSYHLLELHIQESHDSFFAVLAEKKPSFQCFLPTCTEKFWNGSERRDHVISKHNFPPDFRFDEVKKNPRKKSSKDRKENSSSQYGTLGRRKKHADSPRSDQPANETNMEVNGSSHVLVGSKMEVNESTRAVNGSRMDVSGPKDRNGSTRDVSGPRSEVNGSKMDVDGEEVVMRRNTPARRPVSLARMGERRFSVQADSVLSPPPLPEPSHNNGLAKHSFHATSPDVSHEPSPPPQTKPDPIQTKPHQTKSNFGLSRLGIASPPRELGTPPRELGTPRGDGRSPRPETHSPRSLNVGSPRRNIGGCSPVTSPRKSMIPVRSNSCRAPRNFSFGAGVPRAFNRPKAKHWYQSQQGLNHVNNFGSSNNINDMTDMRDVLNSIDS